MLKKNGRKEGWKSLASDSVRTGLAVAFLLTGCGGSKPRAQTQPAQVPASLPVAPPPVTKATVPVVIGPVEKQSTAVLTQSVARVLGFADVGGRTVTVYQDAYSALYGAIQKKNGSEVAAAPKPLLYFSPVFVADTPTWTLMEDGKFRIVIPNKFTVEVVRARVWETLNTALVAIGGGRESVGVLPLASLSGKLKAFGKDYKPEVSKDFSRVVVEIPKTAIPASLRDGPDDLKVDAKGVPALLEFFSALDFDYTYYVQKVNETSCSFNLDTNYVQNMYIDSSCPKETANVTDAQLAAFEASNPNWKDLGTLVKRVGIPITSCLAGSETARTLRRSSISCTRSLQASDGTRSEFQDALLKFAQSTYEQPLANVKLSDEAPAGWNVQTAAAAVAMFGSPEKFAQEITNFNSNILNKDNISDDMLEWNQASDFLDTLEEFQSRDMATEKSSSGGGGGFLFLISFGSSSSSSSDKNSLKEQFQSLRNVSKADRANLMNRIFKQDLLKHEIVDTNGSLKFYPRVTFHVKADVDKINGAAQALNTAELGDIVSENDSFSAEFALRAEYSLHGLITCGPNSIGFSRGIQEVEWWSSSTWFDALSENVNSKLPTDGCASVSVSMWLDAPAGSSFLPPSTRNINVAGTTATGVTNTNTLALSGANQESKKASVGPFSPASGVFTRVEFRP
ncbi:MAG: hypothetical protein IOD12_03600 [Silvanigrellales bacterium]|nr:hypothetical protein [Silvanigrellales bacterium]